MSVGGGRKKNIFVFGSHLTAQETNDSLKSQVRFEPTTKRPATLFRLRLPGNRRLSSTSRK